MAFVTLTWALLKDLILVKNKSLSVIQAGFLILQIMFTVQDIDINTGVKFNAVNDIQFTDGTVTEPVTLQQCKDWMKLGTGATEDALITQLITTARLMCEQYLNISLISRTVTAVLNNSCGGIYFPYGPVNTITSITDFDGNVLMVDGDYKISGTMFKQLLTPKENRLTCIYTAGYTTLPVEFKNAILQQVFYMYNNRGEFSHDDRQGMTTQLSISPMAKTIMKPLRRVG